MGIGSLLRTLVTIAGRAAVDRIAELVTGKPSAPEPERPGPDATPMTWRDVRHNREQEDRAIAAAKAAAAEAERRNAITTRPPKRSDSLPVREDPYGERPAAERGAQQPGAASGIEGATDAPGQRAPGGEVLPPGPGASSDGSG